MTVEQQIRQQAETLMNIPVSLGTEVKGQTYPYGVVYVISGVPNYTLTGNDSTKRKRLQINVYATSYKEAKELAISLYGIDTLSSTNIKEVRVLNEVDLYDNEKQSFGVAIDIEVKEGN